MKTGIELIAQERKEQIEKHGFDVHHDSDSYQENQLINAAMYALTLDRKFYPENWEFWFHDKMMDKQKRLAEYDFWIERLKIAGALIASQIDRLNAQEPPTDKIS